ncbi:deaminase [Arthrobacter sp. 24S4-2]|nr:deaminase [Arthrobacter sp. 24S4-2]
MRARASHKDVIAISFSCLMNNDCATTYKDQCFWNNMTCPDVRIRWSLGSPKAAGSSTLEEPPDWPYATLARGDAADVVARLKDESELPLRSHGSLSLNRTLMAAGLVDRLQVTIFPVISGQTGDAPIFAGAADFDLELIESRTLDGRTQELLYLPTRHH